MFDNRHIKTDVFMATNLPGIFAAGDIAAVQGSVPLNLLVTGFGHAAIAANAGEGTRRPKRADVPPPQLQG